MSSLLNTPTFFCQKEPLVQPTSKPGHELTVYSLDICREMKPLLGHIWDIGATEKFGMHRACLHLCYSLDWECTV